MFPSPSSGAVFSHSDPSGTGNNQIPQALPLLTESVPEDLPRNPRSSHRSRDRLRRSPAYCMRRSPGDFLLVEGPKVFDRTAAAPDDQNIQSHRIKCPDSFYDAVLCAVSLNQGRVEDQLDIWIPSVEIFMISRIAAPVGAVTIPTVFANRGSAAYTAGQTSPSLPALLRVFQISDTGPRARKVRFLTRRAGIFRPARRHPQFLYNNLLSLGELLKLRPRRWLANMTA